MAQKTNPFQKIISTSGINFAFRVLGMGASFFTTILITRLFGLATFGNYSLVFALSQIAALLFTLGIPNTLIKIIGNENFNYLQAKKLVIKGLQAALLFSIFPLLLFFFGAHFLALSVFHNPDLIPYFILVAFSIPLFIVHEILLYFLIATKNFMKYNLFMFVVPNLLLLIFLQLFYHFKCQNQCTFLAFGLSVLVSIVAEIFTIFERNPKHEKVAISTGTLLKTAAPFLFSGLFLFLLNYSNVIVLGILTTQTQVGIYNIAYKIGSVGFLIVVSVSTIITPKMAELYGQGKLLELKKLTHNSTRLIACLTVPIVAMLLLFNRFILSFWGPDVVLGSSTLVIVSVGVLFSSFAGNVDQILNMTGNQNILRNITIVSFFINLGLCFTLIPKFGIEGAAFSSLITNVVINILCLYYIKKKLGFYTLF